MELAVDIRWQDLDALGHVGHAVYLTYFEEQRDRWLTELAGLGGRDYVVASAQVDYELPIESGDGPLLVSSSVEHLGRSSLTLNAVLRSADGQVCARSRTSIVFWDPEANRSRPMTETERAVLGASAPEDVPATQPATARGA